MNLYDFLTRGILTGGEDLAREGRIVNVTRITPSHQVIRGATTPFLPSCAAGGGGPELPVLGLGLGPGVVTASLGLGLAWLAWQARLLNKKDGMVEQK